MVHRCCTVINDHSPVIVGYFFQRLPVETALTELVSIPICTGYITPAITPFNGHFWRAGIQDHNIAYFKVFSCHNFHFNIHTIYEKRVELSMELRTFRQLSRTNYSEIFEKSMVHKDSTQFILKHNVEINTNYNVSHQKNKHASNITQGSSIKNVSDKIAS